MYMILDFDFWKCSKTEGFAGW